MFWFISSLFLSLVSISQLLFCYAVDYATQRVAVACKMSRFGSCQSCLFEVSLQPMLTWDNTRTRGQSNLTKSASRGAHSPVRGGPRGSKVVPLNSWGRVSY